MITTDIILCVCLIVVDLIGLTLFWKKNGKISATDGFIFFSGIGYSTEHIILRLIELGKQKRIFGFFFVFYSLKFLAL